MSTNAYIFMKVKGTDEVKGLYLHWDGYKEYAGKVLFNNYKDRKKVERLMHYRALSNLGTEPTLLRNQTSYAHELYEMKRNNRQDNYGYLSIMDAVLDKFCCIFASTRFADSKGKNFMVSNGSEYGKEFYFDNDTQYPNDELCPDTTEEGLIARNIKHGGDLTYLYDTDDKWKRWSERTKSYLPITKQWLNKESVSY